MKRILSVQDISCVGKCSQTVALPVISAMGIEASILPTALLSTHTAFKNFTFWDLTEELQPITDVWEREGITFDAIYTGYLGSVLQINLVYELFTRFPGKLVFVDPAMGDNGVLYKGFDSEYALSMKKLCTRADVIVPNLTEACALLGMDYPESGYTHGDIENILKRLCDLGAKTSLITGISFEKGKLGVMGYDSVNDRFFTYFRRQLKSGFHGTGDVFAASCAGALTLGMPLEQAVALAVDFTVESISLTLRDQASNWYGVNFEEAIGMLMRRVNKFKRMNNVKQGE